MLKKMLAISCLMAVPAMAIAEGEIAGDPEAGEKVFRKCQACHMVGDGAEQKIGPILNGIVGRAVAADEDFKYSDVLMEMGAEGTVWSVEELDAFLAKPRTYAKGTKMSFAGLRKEEDRTNLIAYLASFPAEGDS